jgi:hypothetical protein
VGDLSFLLKNQRSPFTLTLNHEQDHELSETSKTVSLLTAKANSILPVPTVFHKSLLSLSPFLLLFGGGTPAKFTHGHYLKSSNKEVR